MGALDASLALLAEALRPAAGEDALSSYALGRFLFLRGLGLVYLAAFLSLAVQLRGLVGERGLLPARAHLAAARRTLGAAAPGRVPCLFWLGASDRALLAGAWGGALLAALLLAGVAPLPVLAALALLYLSFVHVGQAFLSFQWDILLVETGVAALFVAPATLLPGASVAEPAPLGIALLGAVLFRLNLESGVVKLTSGDRTWRDGSALAYHYETQPLPTWVAWYVHKLPMPLHRLASWGSIAVEILGPLLLLGPLPARLAGLALLAGLQVAIAATGNYTFFNALTILLCVPLVPDAAWRALGVDALAPPAAGAPPLAQSAALVPFAALVLAVGALQLVRAFRPRTRGPAALARLEAALRPFFVVNPYGLFRVMTTERPELLVEGSRDGERWEAYELPAKPGDPRRRPRFVAPHQPRLDWQMWFAALAPAAQLAWLEALVLALLEGRPEVRRLLRHEPFGGAPPRALRVRVARYRFSTRAERRAEGVWWVREAPRTLLGPVSLPGREEAPPASDA